MSKFPKSVTFEEFTEKVKTYINDPQDLELIKKAYDYANKKLFGKKEDNNE